MCPRSWRKPLGCKERHDATSIVIDRITARKLGSGQAKIDQPARPPIVVLETRRQRHQLCRVYFTSEYPLRRGAALIGGELTQGISPGESLRRVEAGKPH